MATPLRSSRSSPVSPRIAVIRTSAALGGVQRGHASAAPLLRPRHPGPPKAGSCRVLDEALTGRLQTQVYTTHGLSQTPARRSSFPVPPATPAQRDGVRGSGPGAGPGRPSPPGSGLPQRVALVRAVHQLAQHVLQGRDALLLGLHLLAKGFDLLQQRLQSVLLRGAEREAVSGRGRQGVCRLGLGGAELNLTAKGASLAD